MGKVSAGLFVTLDGVAEAPERWNPPYFDGEMAQELGSAMSAADALLWSGDLRRMGGVLACSVA